MAKILSEAFKATGAKNANGTPVTRMHYLINCAVCNKEFWVLKGNYREGKKCSNCRNRKHNQSKSKHYGVWIGMGQRCNNPKALGYSRYGGKGVQVLFTSYDEFYEWSLANGYIENADLTIDRIDSSGNYEPSNCRWIPASLNFSLPNRKAVNQVCLDTGEVLATFVSAKAAATHLGISDASAILKVCKGIRNKAAGFGWTYAYGSCHSLLIGSTIQIP